METEIIGLLTENKITVIIGALGLILGWNLFPQPQMSKSLLSKIGRVLAALIPSISYTESEVADELEKIRTDIDEIKKILKESNNGTSD